MNGMRTSKTEPVPGEDSDPRDDRVSHPRSHLDFPYQQLPVQVRAAKRGGSQTVIGSQFYSYQRNSYFADVVEDIVTSLVIPDTRTITHQEFWNIILHQKIPVTTCLLAVMGLPSTGKTTLINEMLSKFIKLKPEAKWSFEEYMGRKRNDRCLSIYELCVLGGLPHDKYAWSFATNRFGAIYSIICSLSRQDPSIASANFEPTEQGPKFFYDEHVQWLMDQVSKHLKNIQNERSKLTLIQDGLSLINVMDVGVNKALYDFLSIVLLSCRKHFRLAFFSLNRDAPNLHKKPDLPHDRYGERKDDVLVMRHRSRLTYLLHFATLGYKDETDVNNTVIVATNICTEESDVSEKDTFENAKKAILEEAKKQHVDKFINEVQLLNLDADSGTMKNLGQTLQDIIKNMKQYKVELPLCWIILRSLISSLTALHQGQSNLMIMHKDFIIEEAWNLKMKPDDVEDFLTTFTDFGSILYMPQFESLRNIVIVDIFEFTQCLNELFYPTKEREYAALLLKYGIISHNDIKSIVHFQVIDDFMEILSSFAMVTEISTGKLVIVEGKSLQPEPRYYYLPSARIGNLYTLPTNKDYALLEVKSVTFPANLQACIGHGIMAKSEDVFLVAMEHSNVSRFRFQSEGCPHVIIDMIYEGQKSKIVIMSSIDDLTYDATVDACSKFLHAFCDCLLRKANTLRNLERAFAVPCCVPGKEPHLLYCDQDFDLCNECMQATPQKNFRSCWRDAVKKCRHLNEEKASGMKNPAIETSEETVNISETDIIDLAQELGISDTSVVIKDKQKAIMNIVSMWNKKRKGSQ